MRFGFHSIRYDANRQVRRYGIAAAGIGVLCCCPLFSMAIEPVDAVPEAQVTVRTSDGTDIQGRWISFDDQHGLTIELPDKQVRPFGPDEIVRLSNPHAAGSRVPGRVRVELAGGEVLFANPVGVEGDPVEVENAALGKLKIPLSRILRWTVIPARLWNTQAAESYQPAMDNAAGADESTTDDRVWLTNGDVMSGIVTGISERGFTLLANPDQETQIPHDRIAAAAIVAELHKPSADAGVALRLRDGSELTLRDWKFAESGFQMSAVSDYGAIQQLPWEQVSTLEGLGRRWIWLTTLEPISSAQQSLSGTAWESQRDRNVLGQALRVSGRRFHHGLGTHSSSTLVFDLKGEFTSFVTHYGMDDQSGPFADVNVSIRVDGQVRHAEEGVRSGRLFGPVQVDVSGANRLELVVDSGANGDIQDRFNWIDSGLVRK